MHIYEGGDFSTKQEHLQQTYTKRQKKGNVTFRFISPQLSAFTRAKCQERPLAQLGNEL